MPSKASNLPQAPQSTGGATLGNGEDHDAAVGPLRAPPHSNEAEQSVLGGLLIDNEAWPRAAELVTEADFYSYDHRVIFAAIDHLITAGTLADVITVFDR